jgi:hypothetical protein
MKISFDERGHNYIELVSTEEGACIIISAEVAGNSRQTVVNSASLTKEQLISLVSEVMFAADYEDDRNLDL